MIQSNIHLNHDGTLTDITGEIDIFKQFGSSTSCKEETYVLHSKFLNKDTFLNPNC